ncbi:MAG: response regulator [Campylobacterota bacterium]|nr:response regulator [Campylobacterota bacterium]
MNDLVKLKSLTQNLTALYVEDSSAILKQTSGYLEKFFKKVYTAKDGLEGLEKYKQYIPDVVLTDTTMPNMDGFELIKSLQKINPKIKIIIISAHCDTSNLLDAIHLGVCDFIPKPIDRVLLGNALLKVANELVKTTEVLDKDELDKRSDLIEKFEIISKQHTPVEFINHYRGVPIIHDGHVVEVDKKNIIIHVPYIQTKCISYEKFTVVETPLFDNPIELNLLSIDSTTREITLSSPTILTFSPKTRKMVRVEVDDSFKTVLHYTGKKIETTIKDVSLNSISLIIKKTDLTIKEDDDIDLTMGFTTHMKVLNSLAELTQRISSKAKVLKYIENDKENELVLLFDLPKNDEETLGKYIVERELSIIKEFKSLKIGV